MLRLSHFIGLPEMVMNYFKFVAQETREMLASIGVRSLSELIGRTDLVEIAPGESDKQNNLDLSPILSAAGMVHESGHSCISGNPPHDKGELAEILELIMGKGLIPADLETWKPRRRVR